MVFPMYSTVLWKHQNKVAIVVAPILGSITAIASWLGSAKALEGSVTIETTSAILPLVIGNTVSLISGVIYSVICTYVFGPSNFDWERFKTEIKISDDSDVKGLTNEQLAQQFKMERLSPEDEISLRKGTRQGILTAGILFAIFVILWPLPMYGTRYVFSRNFFRGWVVVTFLFGWIASLVIILWPAWQGRKTLMLFALYFTGKKDVAVEGARAEMLNGSPEETIAEEVGEKGKVNI